MLIDRTKDFQQIARSIHGSSVTPLVESNRDNFTLIARRAASGIAMAAELLAGIALHAKSANFGATSLDELSASIGRTKAKIAQVEAEIAQAEAQIVASEEGQAGRHKRGIVQKLRCDLASLTRTLETQLSEVTAAAAAAASRRSGFAANDVVRLESADNDDLGDFLGDFTVPTGIPSLVPTVPANLKLEFESGLYRILSAQDASLFVQERHSTQYLPILRCRGVAPGATLLGTVDTKEIVLCADGSVCFRLPGPSALPETTTTTMQNKMLQISTVDADAEARAALLQSLRQSTEEIAGMFSHLSVLVAEQGEVVDQIGADIDSVAENVAVAHRELEGYSERQRGNIKLMLKLFGCVAAFTVLWAVL